MKGELTKALWRELNEVAAGIDASDMNGEKRRVVLKRKGLARRDDTPPWMWHLTPPGLSILAYHQDKP